MAPAQCPLSYPERFYAAVSFANSDGFSADDDTRLVLYALAQQATLGPNTGPRPWAWNTLDSARFDAWSHLGSMACVEAMRLYVRTLDSAAPTWWGDLTRHGDEVATKRAVDEAHYQAAAAAGTAASVTASAQAVRNRAGRDGVAGSGPPPGAGLTAGPAWCEAPCGGVPLRPRYEHAATLLDSPARLLVCGGYRNGRALRDVHILDLAGVLAWSQVSVTPPLPPLGGHVAVHVGAGRVLLFGGHPTLGSGPASPPVSPTGEAGPPRGSSAEPALMRVLSLDTRVGTWQLAAPSPTSTEAPVAAPTARGGHSACYDAGSSTVWLFGGEGPRRAMYGDVWAFHVATCTWEAVATTGPSIPAPRSAHCAALHGGRLFVYGGTLANGACAAGLYVLDLASRAWSAVALSPSPEASRTPDSGVAHHPTPRAGCAGALVFPEGADAQTPWWVLTGGGDGHKPASDTIALGPLPGPSASVADAKVMWHQVAVVPQRSPLAAEGLSLVAVDNSRILLAACGYNGTYHSAVHALRPYLPRAGARPMAPPQAATHTEPPRTPTAAAAPRQHVPPAPSPRPRDSAAGDGSASAVEQRLASELSVVQRQLAASVSRMAQLESDLALARSKLELEQGRALRAEAENAELRNALESATEAERLLSAEVRRTQADLAVADKRVKGGGLLSYLTV
jgi:acyl-CoA-binding protein